MKARPKVVTRQERGTVRPAVPGGPEPLAQVEVAKPLPRLELAEHRVVVIAGGLGMRLRPLTARCPKPLVKVGDRPLLEIMLRRLAAQGFRRFTFCLHYRPEMFRRHFGDGSRFGVEIDYVEEKERRGTAGALSMLPVQPDKAFLVINGDLLTDMDFEALFRFHRDQGAGATICVHRTEIELPYGVVELNGDRLQRIEERPAQRPLISAGIYLLEPSALDVVPRDRSFDMPELFQSLLDREVPAAAYKVTDYWIDVGCKADLERASERVGTLRDS